MPHCYRDQHTVGAQQKFFEKMPADEVYRRTGIQFMDFNSLFQLDTIRRNGSVALQKADKILFIPDALIYMLTGKAICEYTVASTSQMLNPETGDLDLEILKALGIARDKVVETEVKNSKSQWLNFSSLVKQRTAIALSDDSKIGNAANGFPSAQPSMR